MSHAKIPWTSFFCDDAKRWESTRTSKMLKIPSNQEKTLNQSYKMMISIISCIDNNSYNHWEVNIQNYISPTDMIDELTL